MKWPSNPVSLTSKSGQFDDNIEVYGKGYLPVLLFAHFRIRMRMMELEFDLYGCVLVKHSQSGDQSLDPIRMTGQNQTARYQTHL